METNEILSKYSETLERLKFREFTYKVIYELKALKSSKLGNDYIFDEFNNNSFIISSIKERGQFIIFFYKPKKVKYINLNKSQDMVFSTHQIDDFMAKYSFQDLEFNIGQGEYHGASYSKFKINLASIKNDEFNFKAIISSIGSYGSNNRELLQKDKFSPLDFSKYFYYYFKYNNPKENKEFVYYETPEREKLFTKLKTFYYSRYNYFKFCGPISGGKSTTLIKFKNNYPGVIYFNLKVIKKNYLNENSLYKSIMLYELKNIILNKGNKNDEEKELNEIILNNDILETIFLKLIEFLLKLNIRNILVLDQFRNIDSDSKTFDKIKEKINNSKIGLILSSSINEKGIKNELVLTLNKFFKMPKNLTPENQYYFFYIPNLLENTIVKEKYLSQNEINKDFIDLYEQFSFKTQYTSLLKNIKEIDKKINIINEQITQKMIKQCIFPNPVSLEFILLVINKYIDLNMEYNEENFNLLRKIPLKFIDVHFDDNYFSLHYGFPYIKTLVEDSKKNLDIKKYFEKKMYEEKFYSQFKGPYFEKAVINSILDGKLSFEGNNMNSENIHKIIVNDIIEMKETDKRNNVYTIINRMKNLNETKSYQEKEYNTYINDRINLIEEYFNKVKKRINYNIFLYKELEEELEILKKEKENFENNKNDKDKKKSDKTFDKKITSLYDEKFKDGNILIEQTQISGKYVDSAYLYGNKDTKTLVLLKMKFYDVNCGISKEEKIKMEKHYIQEKCKKILRNIYLNLGIAIETWHYLLILHYDSKEGTYNKNLANMCIKNDLEYIFFDPIEKKFYDKDKNQIDHLSYNYLTNLNDSEFESNPLRCFEKTKRIESFIAKRNRDLSEKISYKEKTINYVKDFEKKYKVSFNDFYTKIKEKYKSIKNIIPISFLNMEKNNYFPILNDNFGYIFLNKNQNGLIFMAKLKNNEGYIILDSSNENEIDFLELSPFINIEEKFLYFVVKLD